jgi:membrane peptidoglycan carboxypeptidase
MSRLKRIREANARRRIQRKSRGARFKALAGRVVKGGTVLAVALALGGGGAGAWLYQQHVVAEPGAHLDRDAILDVIAQESPVLYRDGETRIGVFFAREHRDYVPYERIPKAWVQAIVAAEDQRFWDHPGFDAKGIARAMKANVEAGRVVAGGSTLTQQTAKNLFYRPDRSLRSKLVELVDALRLEAHFSKEDILEFYANQFHVSANGRGLGIGARYFFDKNVEALTPLEAAFLAGMVKAPAAYNPFIGKSEARRAAARARAKARTGYVLDRMLAMGALSGTEHARLVEQEIPFKRGTFRYDSSVLLDEVAARLEQEPFPTLFAELGVDNPSTAGIQVVTTLDPVAQREATYALWHHLSEVGPLLEGQTASALRLPESAAPHPDPDNPAQVHAFSSAAVLGPAEKGGLILDLGGHSCVVGDDGIDRMATVLHRAKAENPYVSAPKGAGAALKAALPTGTIVWASLASPGRCDLELRPALQGAVMVLEDGQIRAMVGGNDNRNFNRATTARRQLGSTWKPLVYSAALGLGWAPTDLLDNREGVFTFEGTWYYPRADHQSSEFVPLQQAGTASENLASIWLLYHLLDRLDARDFRAVAERAGLVPGIDEAREAWIERVRDDFGVISTPSRVPEMAFVAAKQEVLLDGELPETEAVALRSLYYGRGAEAELARVRGSGSRAVRARKAAAVQTNYLRLASLTEACRAEAAALRALAKAGAEAVDDGGLFGWLSPQAAPPPVPDPATFPNLRVRPTGEGLALGCGVEATDAAPWAAPSALLLTSLAAGEGEAWAADGSLWLPGGLRASTLDAVGRAAQRRRLVLENADLWDFESLQHHPDFRALVAMRYLAAYARTLGVESDIPPVLSMPLGAVDISLAEAASMYEGMISGEVPVFEGRRPGLAGLSTSAPATSARTLLIAEIRDRDGELLYAAQPRPRAVAPPEAGRLVADILRSVVRFGTGRRALGQVELERVDVPLAGKTGTTNGFKNAAFLGIVPGVQDDRWEPAAGLTVGVYVGYDDNRPMAKGRTRLAGASGALPAWIGTARGLATAGLVGAAAPSAPDELPRGFAAVPVDPATGRVVPGGTERAALVLGDGLDSDGELSVRRIIAPFTPVRGALSAASPDAALPTVAPDAPGAAGSPPAPSIDDGGDGVDGEDLEAEAVPWIEEMGDLDDLDDPAVAPALEPDGGTDPPPVGDPRPGALDPTAPPAGTDGVPEDADDVVPRIVPAD